MVTIETLCGVVEILKTTTNEELCRIFEELAFVKESKSPSQKDIEKLIDRAKKERWIVQVGDTIILGPSAFPEVPDDLSEVMGILKIDTDRKVDWDLVASTKAKGLEGDIKAFYKKVSALDKKKISKRDTVKVEEEYQRLVNLFYDFEFWLPADLTRVRRLLEKISGVLERLKSP